MILADKIIELRKKNGWSQEELAEKLDVSRQSVSKWESAQSIPDMNKILKLSEVFGVSTDFLLKDEMTTAEYVETPVVEDTEYKVRPVSMEEASEFISVRAYQSGRIALGVMLCILCPVLLIVLGGGQDSGFLEISDTQAGGIGLVVLFIMIGIAVALFVSAGLKLSKYEYMEKDLIDTAYGVKGLAEDLKDKYKDTYTRSMIIGIVLCVISVLPLFIIMAFNYTSAGIGSMAVGLLLIMVAIGVYLLVRVNIVNSTYNILLEEGDYSRAEKTKPHKFGWVPPVYWLTVTAIFLIHGFTSNFATSWIIWAVGGIVFAILMVVLDAVSKKH